MTSPNDAVRRVGVPLALALGAGLVAAWATKARCLLTEGSWDNGEQYLGWCYTDIYPLWWAERLNEGAVPYFDYPVEYPVLTGAWMHMANRIAGLFGQAVDGRPFLQVTMLMGALFLVGTFVLLHRMQVPARRLVWFALAPTLIAYAFVNWDALPVLLATLSIWLHRNDRDVGAGVALGLGAAAKLYPALFLPIFALARLRQGRIRDAVLTTVAAAGAWLAVNVPIALAAPSGWGRFFELSRTRPADHDSLYRIIEVELRSGRTFDVPNLNAVTAVLFIVAAVAVVLIGIRRRDPSAWWQLTLPVLIVFLLTSKVYSPQFSLWLLPLLILALPRAWPLIPFFLADMAVFGTRFPWLGGRLDPPLSPAPGFGVFATAIAVRAAVLLWIAWLVLRHEPDYLGATAPPDELVPAEDAVQPPSAVAV